MRLKSWESPRKQGRNDKGKGGSARQRQIRKQMKMLQQRLKEGVEPINKKEKDKPWILQNLALKSLKLLQELM